MAIEKLNAVAPDASALIPFHAPALGSDARMTMQQLATLMATLLSGPGLMVTQYESPTVSSFNAAVAPPVVGASVFLLIKPSGTLAVGNITMPAPAVDRQEVLVYCSEQILTVIVNGNGKLVVNPPLAFGANAYFRMRYDGVNQTWYRVG